MPLQDKVSIFQVIGCLMKKPDLLREGSYKITKDDFPEKFHKIVFGAINNVISQGLEELDFISVDSFLSSYDIQHKIFEDNEGLDYIQSATETANLSNFEYHYNRLKKFSLLRAYEDAGIDIKEIYDDDLLNLREKEEMQKRFDEYSIKDIVDIIDQKQLEIRARFLFDSDSYSIHISENLFELKEKLKEEPDYGAPLVSGVLNKIFRGAKFENLFMRSAPSNLGKTRLSMADALYLAVDEIFDLSTNKWVSTGEREPTLYITTEMKTERLQPSAIAFVSGVNETKIKNGEYTEEEEKRIDRAIKVLKRSKLWMHYIPNFNIADIETSIRKFITEHGVKYIFFDYVHISIKLLEEIANQSRGVKLREDIVLLMFVDRLKTLCNRHKVYISTSSQVNGDWKNVKDADSTILRGSKAMADKLDMAIIALLPTKSDLEALEPILRKGFSPAPNMVYHIYKNREDEYVNVKLWLYADMGTLRTTDLFLTNSDYEVIPIEAVNIQTYSYDTENEQNEEEIV
ncbi:replicative DNA helicase [Brevibacillus laterosporus]|uniref:replicative DNA helicase n=1 Tax=Brevibacillus laterosporus TaxID=1465 RepID=UPI000E6CF02E|nr:replicative DNA helicase [Brevibacillus laterosporus]AYB37622.1 hypothetical protein D5F52_04615 [Brevibacillus laterosporus]MBM7110865.1 Replicative DNA helicase [Brevibacillus laterosporus]